MWNTNSLLLKTPKRQTPEAHFSEIQISKRLNMMRKNPKNLISAMLAPFLF